VLRDSDVGDLEIKSEGFCKIGIVRNSKLLGEIKPQPISFLHLTINNLDQNLENYVTVSFITQTGMKPEVAVIA
jgi:hypothetical protein